MLGRPCEESCPCDVWDRDRLGHLRAFLIGRSHQQLVVKWCWHGPIHARGIRLDPEHSPNSPEALSQPPFRHSWDKVQGPISFGEVGLCLRPTLLIEDPELLRLLLPRFRHNFQLRFQVINLLFLVLYDCA